MFFPWNLIGGVILAGIYCFIFFQWKTLGRLRKFFFRYSVVAQVTFVLFYSIFSIHLRLNQQNIGLNIFSLGLTLFYFVLYVPFFFLIFYTLYHKIHSLEEYSKMVRFGVLSVILFLLIVLFIIGFYLYIFFFYGFAP